MEHRVARREPRPGFPMGRDLLRDPRLNKGSAFSDEERDALGLRGLLPPRVFTMDEQVRRVMENYARKTSDLERYIFLVSLQDRNETLFYRVVKDRLEEMMPIVYTPTVGEACQHFGHIFRRARGMYVTYDDRGAVRDVLRNWRSDDVRVVVVTDGERILGLGDQGANGMGIPIGKLSLYTACAGIDPSLTMPVLLDVGTENEAYLEDPLYMGLRRRRVRGDGYDAFVGEFMEAIRERWPEALVQFEDFGNTTAFRLLQRWRDAACTFNDDIQGTAAVTLAGLLSALRITGRPLRAQRILFFGAGEAGLGIGDLVVTALREEGATDEEARAACWFVDSKGLIVQGREHLTPHKQRHAHPFESIRDLATVIRKLRPTALVGVSAIPRSFDRRVIEAMSSVSDRPIIFALSNPTAKAEATAEEAYAWSKGRAIFASGSPFPPYTYEGKTFVPGQGNNSYIFPGIGLGVVAAKATRVTDRMFADAARTLAGMVLESDLRMGRVYPSLKRANEVSAAIAATVAGVAFDERLARAPRPEDLVAFVRSLMWEPRYESYVR